MKFPTKNIFLFLSFFILQNFCKAQDSLTNLIYNPSFEDYLDCPKKIESLGIMTEVIGWWQATTGSADYFNKCNKRECSIPENKLGVQQTRTGDAYCGFYVSKTDYREYIETELKEPLQAGRRYRLTFHVSLSEFSFGAVATIGGLFTNEIVKSNSSELLVYKEERSLGGSAKQVIARNYEPQVQNPYDRLLKETRKWEKISGEFVAKGGEKYLTIGNFLPMEHSNYQEPQDLTYILPGAYYYIDDVELVCLDCAQKTVAENPLDPETAKFITQKDSIFVGKTIVLKNLFFEFDKSELLPQSFIELEHLIGFLNENPRMKIEIAGHTDDRGSEEYNEKLSNARAKSVVDYLIKRGVSEYRLRYRGYGKSRPIESNKTEAGRAKNRRVEFKILSL